MSECLPVHKPTSRQSSTSEGDIVDRAGVTSLEQVPAQNQSQASGEPASQGSDLSWNLDGMEDKNPFSGFSEEHLNKLDEVLSSAGVQELLQQSTPNLSFLNLDGSEQLSGGMAHGGQGDTAMASTSRRDSSDSLPESILSVVFSDHGYCMNPEKLQKTKVVTTQQATKTFPAVVTVESVPDIMSVGATPTALGISTDSDMETSDSKNESPATSPRKSGRAHTQSKYSEEDWVTQGSPSKGRGRGRGVMPSMPSPFGFRASTRISDQKQRDLAEKIMLANRQAMEAVKNNDETTADSEPSPVKTSPKGRGRGKGQTSPSRGVGNKSETQSSQEESSQDDSVGESDDDEEEEEEVKEVNESDESESEVETKTKKGGKGKAKVGKKKKKGGKYEQDSDYSDEEEENKKGKKKTKGKKKGKKEEEENTKTKKGKKKKVAKDKKKGKAKKGKKKGAKADKKEDDSDESESKEKAIEKSPKKTTKKLSKKERLKKMKEAKEAKKAKLLEKKKEKKKDKKKKGGKAAVSESDTSPKKKGLKKGKAVAAVGKKKADTVEESAEASPKKRAKVADTKATETKSPKAGEKRKASPARAAKGKAEAQLSTPTKKQKVAAQKKKSKAQVSDSEDEKPLATVKSDIEILDTKPVQAPLPKVTSPRGEQNIFASLSASLEENVSESDKEKPVAIVKSESDTSVDKPVVKNSVEKVPEMEKDNKTKEDVDAEMTAVDVCSVIDSNVKGTVTVDTKDDVSQIKSDDKVGEGRSESDSKDTGVSVGIEKVPETHKRHDSEDSRGSHHHHHHHRRHSHDRKDSVSDDKTDSASHRNESRDRKDSSDRRHSHDRRDSRSQDRDRRSSRSHRDRDRHSRKGSESKDRDRKDSVKDRRESVTGTDSAKKSESSKDRRESVGSVNSDKNGKIVKPGDSVKKVVKGKVKKGKKSEELPVDSSMADLFMPDNLPPPFKEEPVTKVSGDKSKSAETIEVKEKVTKVTFKDDADKDSKKEKEQVTFVGPETIKVDVENKTDKLSDINEAKPGDKKSEIFKVNKTATMSEKNDENIDNKETVKSERKIENENNETKESDTNLDSKMEIGIKSEKDTEKKEKSVEGDKESSDTEPMQVDIEKVEDVLVVDFETKAKSNTENKEKDEDSKESVPVKTEPPKKPKVKNPLKMSDFFSERRLKINDPKPRFKVVKEESSTDEGTEEAGGRSKRNKAKAFAEILKKEKLGSDEEEEEESDPDFEDDENDEDFEDPDQLYCICRQPHNRRFMICCDKCEEWFHGKCVGVTRARGAEMEKNNEDYICPQCAGKEQGDIQDGKVASTTQSPEHSAKAQKATVKDGKEDNSETATEEIKPDSTVDKDTSGPAKSKQQTPKSAKTPGEATPKSQKSLKKSTVSLKSKQAGEATPKSETKKGQESTTQVKIIKGQTTVKGKEKATGTGKKSGDLTEKRKRVIQMVKEENDQKDKPKQPYNKCFACHVKSPRKDSLYCSDDCRAKHSKHNVVPSILKISAEKDKKKTGKKEKHVAVVEVSTGRTLTGDKAPTESELKDWLAENPTFEILKAHNKPTSKSFVSTEKNAESKESSKSEKSTKSEKSEGPEPIRLNVRKGLRDALAARAAGADDMMLSSSEIKGVALSIEEELFKYFKDTDSKYKAKYRSLIFNIKDQKNKGLFRKILTGRVRGSKLVRMTADELANRELAQWREHEAKHTLEMIKQTETEHLNEPVHKMKKTHKGEEEVADEEGEDLSTLADEPKRKEEVHHVIKHDNGKEEEVVEDVPDTTGMHGQHLFDANCKICTGKLVPAIDTTPTKTKAVKTETTPAAVEEPKELTKQERDLQADEVVKEVLKAIQRAKEDERKEELEAQQRSSVTVRSPDSALSSGLDKNVKFTPIGPMLWKGFIFMQDVCKFVTTAYTVTGSPDHLSLPDTIVLCGRISPEHVWDYLNKVKQSATRDICVIRFIPGTGEEKAAYINLYSYLNSRSRCGVVDHKAKNVKDFYIVPLASHSKIPSVLLPFDGPGLEENRCHMLLGVIIRNKVKQSSISSREHSKSSHSRHTHRPSKSKPLKSALKDPTKTAAKKSSTGIGFEGENSDTASSNSPKTSSSSSTPHSATSSDKKRAISFDPIVKEYSHVTEQEMAIGPVPDDPLDLNAPYDPEKEAMKDSPKPKSAKKPDPITLMMEKIAHSKNPAEATAAMVAALATQPKLGNQRKLLLELTKKVDEQKRLLEQKRISSKLGQSPSGNSPSTSSPAVSSTSVSSIGISSKDPRLRAAHSAAVAAAAASANTASAEDNMDIDLRIKPGGGASGGVAPPTGVSAPVGLPPPTGVSAPVISSSLPPQAQSSILPSTITASALENSVSILSSLTSDIASGSALPVKDSLQKSNANEKDEKLKQSTGIESVSIDKPKGFYVDHASTENKKDKSSESVSEDKNSTNKTNDKEKLKQGAQHEIVTQLMAEVSGKSVSDTNPDKQQADSKESEIQSESEKSKVEDTAEKVDKQVPNVAALFKGLAENSESGKKSGIQLPTALMTLFSKLPGSAEDPEEEAPAKIPGLFTADMDETGEDTDLRESSEQSAESVVNKRGNKGRKKPEEKVSKTFLGFDYDSDSSGGSFEGFDDDGTKKLSPRKRKLVQKSPSATSSGKTNLFGDVDERGVNEEEEDVDFRQDDNDDDVDLRPDFGSKPKDIDNRLSMHIASGQPLPPGEGPVHPFAHPPGVRLPFIPTSQPMPPGLELNQPPPPGVDWEHPPPTTMPMGMPGMMPPSREWGQPPLPDSQPPLPAEPPMPKPPEPPMKKKMEGANNDDDSDNEGETKYQSKNSRKKKKKKERKNKKGEPVASDERLAQIVLEIAKNKPLDPPPMPPKFHKRSYNRSQQMMSRPSMGVPPVMTTVPQSSPIMPPTMPGVDMSGVGLTSWIDSGSVGQPLNAQSQMIPPNLPPHMQPGVAPNSQPMPLLPTPNTRGRRPLRSGPPSLLDLPDLPPPPKLMGKSSDMAPTPPTGSPLIREPVEPIDQSGFIESEQNVMQPDANSNDYVTEPTNRESESEERRSQEDRSHERDRDERRRRSRSRERRSRSNDKRYRSRSRERGQERRDERSRDRYYRDSRDRDRGRDRGYRSRRR